MRYSDMVKEVVSNYTEEDKPKVEIALMERIKRYFKNNIIDKPRNIIYFEYGNKDIIIEVSFKTVNKCYVKEWDMCIV